MAALKTKAVEVVPVEDVGHKQTAIMRALLELGGQPKGFTKAKATKVGATGYRVNIFAKSEAEYTTDRIVYSTFLHI